MSDLKSQFEAAVNYVQTVEGDSFKPSNDLKLEMYGLFKQGSTGDVQGKRPGMTNFIARAKYLSSLANRLKSHDIRSADL